MSHHRQPPPYRQHKRYNKTRYNNNNFRRKQRRQEWQEIERVGGEIQYVKGCVVDLVENVTKYVDNLRDHVAEQFSLRPICPPPGPCHASRARVSAPRGRGGKYAAQTPHPTAGAGERWDGSDWECSIL